MMFARYLDIPHADRGRSFEGVDCWGLAWLLYDRELGIELPGFEARYHARIGRDRLHDIISEQAGRPPWTPVGVPRPFDIILRRVGRYATHLGVVVDPDRVLHVHARRRSVVAPLTTAFPPATVVGCFRHEALA